MTRRILATPATATVAGVAARAIWAPYRPELDGCECAACRATGPAARRILLGMLRAGTHQRTTLAEAAATAREIRDDRLRHLRATGAPAHLIATVERGYGRAGSCMVDGIGIGMTPTRSTP
ncbi:hypothetical protein [Micromonospora sp. NBRC 101691]|uniref:hypothetical protein n=1 Tax=Micromonospora sp. NBRC 101691 TaxID=3032198 RepID=UPI0024A57642|nr:hypothetical protein [Micromonospora sp. NBRC 101691]GLY21677.1 hypothetical protein Misp04_14090 [Micromonospora sp. NBRC 101691]